MSGKGFSSTKTIDRKVILPVPTHMLSTLQRQAQLRRQPGRCAVPLEQGHPVSRRRRQSDRHPDR